MKNYLFAFLTCCCMVSCTSGLSNDGDGSGPISVSQRIADVDSLKEVSEAKLREPSTVKKKFEFPLFSDKDYFGMARTDNDLIQISFTGYNGDLEVGPIFYLQNEKIYFFRYRSWKKTGNAYGHETQIYFDGKENFVYASERHIDIEEGQHPRQLLDLPFLPSKRSKEELMAEFNALWLPIKKEAFKD